MEEKRNTVLLSVEPSQLSTLLKKCTDTDAKQLTRNKLSHKLKSDNQAIVGEKCVKKDDDSIAFCGADKLTAWDDHYKRLLNIEFSLDVAISEDVPAVEGPPPLITKSMVSTALNAMKSDKTTGL